MSKKDLLKDLESAVDHDMSTLFKKVYEEEYGTIGGNPFSLLIGGSSPESEPTISMAVAKIVLKSPLVSLACYSRPFSVASTSGSPARSCGISPYISA